MPSSSARSPLSSPSVLPHAVPASLAKSAEVFFIFPAQPPFFSSASIAGTYLIEALESQGYAVRRHFGRLSPETQADYLPFSVADLIHEPAADLTLFDAGGLRLLRPDQRSGGKKAVFFHSFLPNPALWLGNAGIDGFWGNSPYATRVLQSLLALPDWSTRTLLEPRAWEVVHQVTLPLPYFDHPQGIIERGAPLPRQVVRDLGRGDYVGHCLTHKPDVINTALIVLELNRLARRARLRRGLRQRRFRLLVNGAVAGSRSIFGSIRAAASRRGEIPEALAAVRRGFEELRLGFDDLFLEVPPLHQRALFRVLGLCRFGLFFNWVPETLGFYALESVVHGSKLYTNGAGNLRFLVPAEHGVEVREPIGLGFGDPDAAREIAEAIFADVVDGGSRLAEETTRGREFIRAQYSRERLERELAGAVSALATPRAEPIAFDSLRIAASPLLRRWDPSQRRALTDFACSQFDPAQAELFARALGRPAGEFGHSPREAQLLDQLFHLGALALERPEGAARGAST